jgi:hypothetical protein
VMVSVMRWASSVEGDGVSELAPPVVGDGDEHRIVGRCHFEVEGGQDLEESGAHGWLDDPLAENGWGRGASGASSLPDRRVRCNMALENPESSVQRFGGAMRREGMSATTTACR